MKLIITWTWHPVSFELSTSNPIATHFPDLSWDGSLPKFPTPKVIIKFSSWRQTSIPITCTVQYQSHKTFNTLPYSNPLKQQTHHENVPNLNRPSAHIVAASLHSCNTRLTRGGTSRSPAFSDWVINTTWTLNQGSQPSMVLYFTYSIRLCLKATEDVSSILNPSGLGLGWGWAEVGWDGACTGDVDGARNFCSCDSNDRDDRLRWICTVGLYVCRCTCTYALQVFGPSPVFGREVRSTLYSTVLYVQY
jgi:hypothetical protein